MKNAICTAIGIVGGFIANLFGGWDAALTTLVLAMAIDYASGLIVAGVFHSSPKTHGGGLDSRVGWKGLARKFVTVLIVVVANLADVLLELHYIRDAVIIGFCANECISILENAGLMGIRIPGVLREALEKLSEEGQDGTAA